MDNELYQNIDTPQTNPLSTAPAPPQPALETPITPPVKPSLSPKIVLLIVLGIILVILLIISAVLTLIRKSSGPSSGPQTQTTPAPTSAVTPTLPPESDLIPTQYLLQFQNVTKQLNPEPEFLPPEIDPDIGI